MVVWGYPCESKSSPAHYSNPFDAYSAGGFFYAKKKDKIRKKKKDGSQRFSQQLCEESIAIENYISLHSEKIKSPSR